MNDNKELNIIKRIGINNEYNTQLIGRLVVRKTYKNILEKYTHQLMTKFKSFKYFGRETERKN